MAVQITIRNVPEDVRASLAQKATFERRSMQEYLLDELERLAVRPSTAQILEQLKLDKARTKTTLSAAEILQHRDADRR